jgi:hypothetical protein
MVSIDKNCHKVFPFFKNGHKKCPKMKSPKNFPQKKTIKNTTYEGKIFLLFLTKSTKNPSICSIFVFTHFYISNAVF